MIEVMSYNHLVVTVEDFEQALPFYRDVLKLPQVPRPDLGWPGAWFKIGKAQLHLVEEAKAPAPTRRHFALEVRDFDAALAAVKGHKVQVTRGPGTYQGGLIGVKYLLIKDPSGNDIEINHSPG